MQHVGNEALEMPDQRREADATCSLKPVRACQGMSAESVVDSFVTKIEYVCTSCHRQTVMAHLWPR